jgi:predicted DNA-binding mobile mystery protein A
MLQIVSNGLDGRIEPLLAARGAAVRPVKGWLRTVRSALNLTQGFVAEKLHIKRQALAQLEDAEVRGAITLGSLERAANAMDCDLVYFIVPRESSAPTFSELARRYDPHFRHLRASEHSMSLEGQAVGDLEAPPPATP